MNNNGKVSKASFKIDIDIERATYEGKEFKFISVAIAMPPEYRSSKKYFLNKLYQDDNKKAQEYLADFVGDILHDEQLIREGQQ